MVCGKNDEIVDDQCEHYHQIFLLRTKRAIPRIGLKAPKGLIITMPFAGSKPVDASNIFF